MTNGGRRDARGAPPLPLRTLPPTCAGLVLVDGAAMLVGMVLRRFTGVVGRMKSVPVSDMGVVRR